MSKEEKKIDIIKETTINVKKNKTKLISPILSMIISNAILISEKSKRENNYPLDKPVIKEVSKNTFYNWLENQNKLGGQNKILRINENKGKINEILAMENKN